MNQLKVTRPKPKSLDWTTSIAAGWDPNSGDVPTYSFGKLTTELMEHRAAFEALIELVSTSADSFLLDPIKNVEEPDFFPEVLEPIDEQLVVINPEQAQETGLHPFAALWQSGWANSDPYIAVRRQVFENLFQVAAKLRSFDPKMYLCITDGWRSIDQQRDLYNAFYPNGHVQGKPLYVSEPHDDDRYAAPHPSGGAVDVLIGYEDNVISIGSDLDYMDVQANTDHFESDESNSLVRDMRRLFSNLLSEFGFVSIDSEWWHVEYGTRRWAGKTGNEALYGNVILDKSIYEGIKPVAAVEGSKRLYLQAISGLENNA